jgi:hypothetical protein
MIVNSSNDESHTLIERTMKAFFEVWVLLYAVNIIHESMRDFTVWKESEDTKLFTLIFVYSYFTVIFVSYVFEVIYSLLKEVICRGKRF